MDFVPIILFVKRGYVGWAQSPHGNLVDWESHPFFPDFLGHPKISHAAGIFRMVYEAALVFQDKSEALFKVVLHGLLQGLRIVDHLVFLL
jgi:hypothetical protein